MKKLNIRNVSMIDVYKRQVCMYALLRNDQ